MSGGFGPFCKTVAGAVSCKAFNDAGSGNESQVENESVSNLFRNVPFLTSLEVSLFLLICCFLGVSAGAKSCAAVCAARLGRSGGGRSQKCLHLRLIRRV